jgi:heme exporter protein C
MTRKDATFYGLAGAFAVTVTCAILQIFLRTPVAPDTAGGVAQKILYFHAAVADAIYVTGGVCCMGSTLYIARPSEAANAWARAGAECAALFGVLALASGLFWAKAWGRYWVWDPQLTTTLLSVLVYWAICVLRTFGGEGAAERRFAGALGVMGTVNLPIIYYSVRQWSNDHPPVIRTGGGGLTTSMWPAFILGQIALTLLLPPLLLWLRSRVALLEAQLDHIGQEALMRGLVDQSDELGSNAQGVTEP